LYEAKRPNEYQHSMTGGLALVKKRNGQFAFCIVDPRVFSINSDGKHSLGADYWW
jgi:hypothetical protein